MSNLLKTVSEIQVTIPELREWLPTYEQYLAHTRKDKTSEPFEVHVILVNKYFKELCQSHGLDDIIDSLVSSLIKEALPHSDTHYISQLVKKYFVLVVCFHDFGKVNDNFQADPNRMNNAFFKIIPNHLIGTTHSSLGAYLF
jgi:CRISPR-associated endonuclease/helicase Cas3